jgi:phosphopentomutase
VKATGLDALFDATIKEMKEAGDKTIVFTNFVDFDSSWGHRRDIAGYAAGLELFDRRLPELMELVGEDDILILTADHGCDPSWQGTDHTREHIRYWSTARKLNRARWATVKPSPISARPWRNTLVRPTWNMARPCSEVIARWRYADRAYVL